MKFVHYVIASGEIALCGEYVLPVFEKDIEGNLVEISPGLPPPMPASGRALIDALAFKARGSTHYVSSGAVVAYTSTQAAAKAAVPPYSAQWNNTLMRWDDLRSLDEVKRDSRQRMAQAWNAARAAGVTFGAKTAPTDADSWTRYLAIKEMAADGGWVDVPIPLADGTFELMTQAKMVTLWGALKDMERTLLTRLRDRVQSINAATTQAQVEAVVW